MSQEVEISIVTPCFNTGKLIEDLAASLESQTFKAFEWCVSDDGSDEETRAILRRIEKDASFAINVQYFEKKGGNYCRNRGFDVSTGRFIKFVDADDILEADLLEKQHSIASANPEDLILSPTKVLKANNEEFIIPLDKALKNDSLRSYLRKPTFMHGGCLLPRHMVSQVGCWDESLHAGQDLDFYRRVLLTDPQIQFAGSNFVYRNHNQPHRISKLTNRDLKKFEGHLKALDKFLAVIEADGKLASYSTELAQNYDIWGMKALALGIPFAKRFLGQAKKLSPHYRSGSRYSRVLRKVMGDRAASKLIRSSIWKACHQRLVNLGLWSKH